MLGLGRPLDEVITHDSALPPDLVAPASRNHSRLEGLAIRPKLPLDAGTDRDQRDRVRRPGQAGAAAGADYLSSL
jgi:hypothetical protein